MPISFYMFYGCFHAFTADMSSCERRCLAKPEIFPNGPFTESLSTPEICSVPVFPELVILVGQSCMK